MATITTVLTLAVEGMTCGSCQAHVRRALEAVPGSSDVTVDLASGEARVTVSDMTPHIEQALIEAVQDAGYKASRAASPAARLTFAGGGHGSSCCSR